MRVVGQNRVPQLVGFGSVKDNSSDAITVLEDALACTLGEAGNDTVLGLMELHIGAAIAFLDTAMLGSLEIELSALSSRNPEDDDRFAILD